MMNFYDLKDQMPLMGISRISGIYLSVYFYRHVDWHIQRFDPSTTQSRQTTSG